MTDRLHAIVWLDHREAKIFHIDATNLEPAVIYSHASGRHLQHKANTTGSGHKGVDKEFFERVIDALAGIDAILITGPASAKMELKNCIAEHHPLLAKRISAVEALDHPSDGALIALAKKIFRADDRMQL
jgi:stalled ribosome rescue protein Dom34